MSSACGRALCSLHGRDDLFGAFERGYVASADLSDEVGGRAAVPQPMLTTPFPLFLNLLFLGSLFLFVLHIFVLHPRALPTPTLYH